MNYFKAHPNKKPKKTKYSKPYSKIQRQKIEECIAFLNSGIDRLKII